MTRTQPTPLLLAALVGMLLGFALDSLLATRGLAVIVPPVSLAVALVLIAAVVLAMAWPVRSAASGEKAIDPFFATRVVVLAKASALGGALLAGSAAGIVIYLMSRAVVPLGSTLIAGATVAAAGVLVIASLVAEHWCSLPPEEPTEEA